MISKSFTGSRVSHTEPPSWGGVRSVRRPGRRGKSRYALSDRIAKARDRALKAMMREKPSTLAKIGPTKDSLESPHPPVTFISHLKGGGEGGQGPCPFINLNPQGVHAPMEYTAP